MMALLFFYVNSILQIHWPIDHSDNSINGDSSHSRWMSEKPDSREFFPYIFQTTNGQIVNSWTVAAPMDPHLGTMISNGKISCMNFRSKCFSSIWMKSPSSSTQRWRRDLTSAKIWQIPSLGPKRAPTCFELVVVLFSLRHNNTFSDPSLVFV